MSKTNCHALLQELAATLATAEVASECWCAEPGEASEVQRRIIAGLASQAARISKQLETGSATPWEKRFNREAMQTITDSFEAQRPEREVKP